MTLSLCYYEENFILFTQRRDIVIDLYFQINDINFSFI